MVKMVYHERACNETKGVSTSAPLRYAQYIRLVFITNSILLQNRFTMSEPVVKRKASRMVGDPRIELGTSTLSV